MAAFVTYDGDIEIAAYESLDTVAKLNREATAYVAYFLAPLQDGKVASCRIAIRNFPMV